MKISLAPLFKAVCVATLCVFSLAGFSQSPDFGEDRVMFIKITDLDTDTYASLAKAVQDNDDISIRYACVPASILMFDIAAEAEGSLDEYFQVVKLLTTQNTSLSEVQIIAEYSEEDFMARCQMFRTSTSVE